MHDYEKLGVFYLGRYYDLAARRSLPDLLLYDSNDLLTHALCVGMTGSGKTGLCLGLIEEAVIDGIPAILIDPKGDLANLLLTFPDLRPEDFAPWVNPDDARKKGIDVPEFAAQQAELWRKGLAQWNQDGERIRRLRDAAEFAIYTPGSNAGLPVSILNSFAAPPPSVLEDPELLRERVTTTVSGLLGLLRVEGDTTRSREAIFLANILQRAWQDGRNLDLGELIHEIQSPSITRVGVMEVETFYPAKARFELATTINGLLASPGFSAWLDGEPLDIQRLYHSPTGKPRVAIFSIAHLGDAERMFFVTLLLNQLLGWMRTRSGTTSLRSLFYMDEIFGYFPPVANPPSKLPLLTLLKQGRAFGVGVVLATQNPVDLDYKGLANIGTWFLGRLQTERDKQRVLEGLEGAAASQGSAFDRPAMERTLAALGNRVFLLRNVHEEGAAIFESRWCLSYLRGPLARAEIKTLMANRRAPSTTVTPPPIPVRPSNAPAAARMVPRSENFALPNPAPSPGAPAGSLSPTTPGGLGSLPAPATAAIPPAPAPAVPPGRARPGVESGRPSLPPEIPQFFLPVRQSTAPIVYLPMLLGAASVRYADARNRIDTTRNLVLLTPIDDSAVPVDWSGARELDLDPNDLERMPVSGATFAPLPPAATQAKKYPGWQKDFVNAIHRSNPLVLLRSTSLELVSAVDESEGDFRVRLQEKAHERRDALVAKLRTKYAPRLAILDERLRKAEQALERESGQARQATLSSVLSFGSTLLGAFLGRKAVSSSTVRRAGTAVRSAGRASQQSSDVARARESVDAVKRQIEDLDAQFKAEIEATESACDPLNDALDRLEIRPTKANIAVRLQALVWAPHADRPDGSLPPAY